MQKEFPFTIDNGHGERLTFKQIIAEQDGDKLLVEGVCSPKAGPPMHVHFMQEEGMTIVQGRMGYQFPGKEPAYIGPGDSVTFHRNQPHRFWNAGDDDLVMHGFVKPVNTVVFYLTTLFNATKNSKNGRADLFDLAYLMTRYKNEYAPAGMAAFVQKVMLPATYFVGKLLGKYRKFKDAPKPL
jgi:quercetin dioxygenase-like cupin family protein